ncbi:MAG: prepilin-type N-terminal cleavage/methylation domain-containing protein [Verrucomicrobia bacterium]|nr:prepilin-type N-terminal cleavage/methylation domain-containing protein [Verrucomicrobiota bacterium]
MKTPSLKATRAGFTLVEVMVAAVIMIMIILAVVQIASDSFRAYDRSVADLATQSEARGVLDAMENDFQTAVIRPDGRCWMEIVTPGTSGFPAVVGNLAGIDHPIVMLFSAPTDRPRRSPVATTPPTTLKGDVCAVAYRIGQRSPFDMPGEPIQQVYGVYRTIVDPEKTFADATSTILNGAAGATISPFNYWNASRLIPEYAPATGSSGYHTKTLMSSGGTADWTLDDQNFIGANVVAMNLVLWCSSSLPATATAPALSDPCRRLPTSLRPVLIIGDTARFSAVPATDGGYNAAFSLGTTATSTALAPLRFSSASPAGSNGNSSTAPHPYDYFSSRMRIYSDRMYPDDSTGPFNPKSASPLGYLPYSLKAIEVSITILTPDGSKELRGLQQIKGAAKLSDQADFRRIVYQYGRNYTRYIRLLGNGG